MRQKFYLGEDGLFYPENNSQPTAGNSGGKFGVGTALFILFLLWYFILAGGDHEKAAQMLNTKSHCRKGTYWEQVQELKREYKSNKNNQND